MRKFTIEIHPLSALLGALGLGVLLNILGAAFPVQHGPTPVVIRGPLKVKGIPAPNELLTINLDADSSGTHPNPVASYTVPPGKVFVVRFSTAASQSPSPLLIDGAESPPEFSNTGIASYAVSAGSVLTEANPTSSPSQVVLVGWLENE